MAARDLPDKFLVAFSLAGEQRDLVRAIAVAVEAELGRGRVFLDEWFEHYIAGDDADLRLQDVYSRRCDLAVLCVSERYGAKPWTRAEHRAIRARYMECSNSDDSCKSHAILPIRVGDGEVEGILFNSIVPDIRGRLVSDVVELIIARLRLLRPDLDSVPRNGGRGPSWPRMQLSLSWPMANHSGARDAFAQLMTAEPPWRLLRMQGGSETGKSHVTRQMLANALAIPEVACGRFDFKGTTDMDREVRAFVQDLGVQVPAGDYSLHERLDLVLASLKSSARPTLLIFDTYEMAGQAREWVEKSLLQSLFRATWMRVVIAGQQVPDASGAVWGSLARGTLQLAGPPAQDWFDYGRQHRANLTLADVETACRLAANKVSLLAQLFGPAS